MSEPYFPGVETPGYDIGRAYGTSLSACVGTVFQVFNLNFSIHQPDNTVGIPPF